MGLGISITPFQGFSLSPNLTQGFVSLHPGLLHFTPLGFRIMRNQKFQLLVIIGIVFLISSIAFTQTKKKSPLPKPSAVPSSPIDDEDYSVYSAVLKELYGGKSIALENQVSGCTGIGNNKEGEASWQKSLDGLSGKLKKLSPKTIADFKGKSNLCRMLDAKFNPSIKLISKQERRTIFSGKDMRKAWAAFNKKFPGANGYVIVSNVGFNEDRTQALVDISNKCGDKCGAEQFVLLTKINGSWSVIGMNVVWEL